MARTKLEGLRVAVLAADGFEQVELTVPMKELRRQGAVVEVVSIRPGQIKGMHLIFPGKRCALTAWWNMPIQRYTTHFSCPVALSILTCCARMSRCWSLYGRLIAAKSQLR